MYATFLLFFSLRMKLVYSNSCVLRKNPSTGIPYDFWSYPLYFSSLHLTVGYIIPFLSDFVKDILQIFPAFLEKIVSFSFSHHAGERIFAMEAETFPAFVKKPLES